MTDLPATTLVLGGARSGKSVFAESLIPTGPAVYLATARAGDAEMAQRIEAHRARRGKRWTTHEVPLDLADAVALNPGIPLLVDCLTPWISNLMEAGLDVEDASGALCRALEAAPGPVILVSNEVGMGLVPETPLGRVFRDHQGRVNQAVARACRRVVFVAAGLPLILKDERI